MVKAKYLPLISLITLIFSPFTAPSRAADPLPLINSVPTQPLKVQINRLITALDYLGRPLSKSDKQKLNKAFASQNPAQTIKTVQAVLDPHCLAAVVISPESRVKVLPGPAKPNLVQLGWRQFLVKVYNKAGVTSKLAAHSKQALPLRNSPQSAVPDRWMGLQMFEGRPLAAALSGINLEYRIIQIYSRDKGKRSAVLAFNVGQGTQDIGFRNDITLTFTAARSTPVKINLLDTDGKPTTAAFTIRDLQGRVYPSQAKRLAPDFAFHPQIYRSHGETLTLPPGKYHIKVQRGPEYYTTWKTINVTNKPSELKVKLQRWIDPAKNGWWSGDHHIHAAGCAHYTNPTEGVHASDMMRHILGEDLKIGANLTWGPCFDYQKQFFTGKDDKVSKYPYILRYDVEVSGFGSHQSGHLCLLRLKEQIHPGGKSKHHWPKLCLNTLKWAQKQGAVCGPAHSGWGLDVKTDKLPNYIIPPFSGIGANEYIVDVTHMVEGPNRTKVPAVDFMSTVDTPIVWELNIWYHTLNCGFRTRISGETDFPCIYGERVGLGRSYVKLDGKLTYDDWCAGIEKGRAYVGDGRSHLMDFTVGNREVGTKNSELHLKKPSTVKVTANVAALLAKNPVPHIKAIRKRHYTQKPYWHIERARIGDSRQVKVELLLNGYPVASKDITADGKTQQIAFNLPIKHSSWVAMRIYGSSHTNPIFVLVDNKPIRASKRSAEWCLKSVEQCWKQKQRFIPPNEMKDAVSAYDHARKTYKKIITQSISD